SFAHNENMRIDEAIEGFLRTVEFEYGYSAHTIKAYRNDLRSLLEFIEPETVVAETTGAETAGNEAAGDEAAGNEAAGVEAAAADVEVLDLELLRAWLWDKQQRGYAPGT